MACPICENDKGSIVYKNIPNLTRCSVCNHVYVFIPYTMDFYDERYFTKECDTEGTRDFLGEPYKLYDEARFSQEIKRIKRFKTSGKVLDIGCAMGGFLKMIAQEGFTPYGIDISPFAVSYCRSQYDFPVFSGSIAGINFDLKMFDLITIHHVLEHISHPIQLLKDEVRPIIKDDGLLIVEVPNFASLESRVNGEQWVDLRVQQHINQFTPKSLKLCLEKAGFVCEKIVTYTPHTHVLLWRYPFLLSFMGLSDHTIRGMGKRLKAYCGGDNVKQAGSLSAVRKRSVLDVLSRLAVRPMDLLYANLRLGKYVAIYARPASTGACERQ